jgi:hypothetical protein
MDTKDKIKETATKLRTELKELKVKLKQKYEAGLKELFRLHPDVVSIRISINNHEFNDGDATYFSLHYDDLTLVLKNGEEVESYPKTKQVEKFIDLFKSFDIENFYEDIYGEEYESVIINAP